MNKHIKTTGPEELSEFLNWTKDFLNKKMERPVPETFNIYYQLISNNVEQYVHIVTMDRRFANETVDSQDGGWKTLGPLTQLPPTQIDKLASQLPANFSVAQEWYDTMSPDNPTVWVRVSREMETFNEGFFDYQEVSWWAPYEWQMLIKGDERTVNALYPRCPDQVKNGEAFYPFVMVFPREHVSAAQVETATFNS